MIIDSIIKIITILNMITISKMMMMMISGGAISSVANLGVCYHHHHHHPRHHQQKLNPTIVRVQCDTPGEAVAIHFNQLLHMYCVHCVQYTIYNVLYIQIEDDFSQSVCMIVCCANLSWAV